MVAIRGGSLKDKYSLEVNDTDTVTKSLETFLGVVTDNGVILIITYQLYAKKSTII